MTKNRRHDIVKPSKYKTSMCTFFLSEEGCPFGDKCAFAHGEDELRSDPRDTAALPEAATAVPATSAKEHVLTPDPPHLEQVDLQTTLENGQQKGAPVHQLHRDPHVTTATTLAGPKKRAKKGGCDSTALLPGNTRSFPAGSSSISSSAIRGDASATRGRAVLNSRQQRPLPPPPPPPPPPGHGVIPPSVFGLAGSPSVPASFGLADELGGLSYGSIPGIAGMPHYIPAMGHHPFSVINNNQHTINVAPVMHSPVPYTTLSRTVQLSAPPPLPPPPPTLPSGTVASSSASTSVTGSGGSAVVATTFSGEGAKRRQLQPARHVVSSNTMAHSTSRHATNESSAAPGERTTPQYVYGLMAAAGVLPGAAPSPGKGDPSNYDAEQRTQPRLIVVPHPSNLCNYTALTARMGYQLPGSQSGTAFGGVDAAPSEPRHSGSMPEGCGSDVQNPSPAPATRIISTSAPLERPHLSSVVVTSPAPAAAVHIPSNRENNGLSGGMSIGDRLWGPAEGTVYPITPSLASHTTAATLSNARHSGGAGDYDAILSGLGIGGSSYTTIPLDSLTHQRRPAVCEDDAAQGGDLDWTSAVERWLQNARDEGIIPGATASLGDEALRTSAKAAPMAVASTISTGEDTPTVVKCSAATVTRSTHLLQGVGCDMAVLKSDPFLVTEGTEANMTRPLSPVMEAKRRKTTAVCQVSRAAVDKPSKPQRRAPVTENHFKSSCAAEADSGSVLLYCAEKNTFVYITSGAAGASMAATPRGGDCESALPTATPTTVPSHRDVKSPVADAAPTCVPDTSSDICNNSSSNTALGVYVRFLPGRKKRLVLEEVSDEDAEYCI